MLRFGWDCHGLPIEHEIDKLLNIKTPEDVAKMGIKAYNAECRAIVMKYSSEWETTVTRIGRWIDFRNDYKTLNTPFMESVWWVFQELFNKGQIYKGFSIMPYSTACTTPMSNFEANSNYKDVNDPAVVITFPLKSDPSVAFLAWTTTPWTLPSNLGLCVNPNYEYVKIRDEESGSVWILLQSRLEILYKDVKKAKYTILEKFLGSTLKGVEYEPLYPYFLERKKQGAFTVMVDTYVTDDSGTGIVHCAPLSVRRLPCSKATASSPEVTDYAGMYIKDADKIIQKDLKQRGRLVRQSQFMHSYPFCWRSDTPLIYRAVPSWFVRVTNIKERLLKNNSTTLWRKRFANWLDNVRDWNISRNRYWGTPIPLWISDDGEEIVCVGSVKELEELTGVTGIKDLHRDSIDDLTIPSRQGKGVLRRTTEVLDCWFESGSMPFAQQHYPFENADKFKSIFPADFIAEGLDQTRGWFYTLLVLSTHLFDKAPWKNLIVNGLVLASDGKKMSKSKKNYPDPNVILEQFGADVLRLYLLNSPWLKSLTASVFLPWYNAYRFFFAQVALLKKIESDNLMDQWVLASTQTYRLYTVVPSFSCLLKILPTVHRFNRKRLKGGTALNTLFEVLLTLCKMMTCIPHNPTRMTFYPLPPFPRGQGPILNDDVERAIGRMRQVIEAGEHSPSREIIVINPDPQFASDIALMESYIVEELNVKSYGVRYELKPDHKHRYEVGKEYAKVRKALGTLTADQVSQYVETSKLTLDGVELIQNDLEILRLFDGSSSTGSQYEATSQTGVLGLTLEKFGQAQEEGGLQPVDDIHYFYKIVADPEVYWRNQDVWSLLRRLLRMRKLLLRKSRR
ncbi:tRNA synthetases class I-domain-containing protein [Chytridium lagenaria]|nr:tRNA synthetases class I-domain-containing protein [Chytridium lagenaria]